MHKFEVGQSVRFEPNTWYYRNTVPGSYEVRKQLPERNGEFEYRVKSANEAHERVATESQIRRAGLIARWAALPGPREHPPALAKSEPWSMAERQSWVQSSPDGQLRLLPARNGGRRVPAVRSRRALRTRKEIMSNT